MKRRHKPTYTVGTEPCRLSAGICEETGLAVSFVCRSGIRYTPLEEKEARRWQRMFNRKNGLIEVNPGRMLLPSKYEELG
jgi:hypothetical protein